MSSLDDANPVERENAESPRILSQSVLDWASPDEERDNPGKLDGSGHSLASFSELRTQEANKKPGNWTVNHCDSCGQVGILPGREHVGFPTVVARLATSLHYLKIEGDAPNTLLRQTWASCWLRGSVCQAHF